MKQRSIHVFARSFSRWNRWLYLAAAALFLVPAPARAETVRLTFQEAVRIALERNGTLLLAKNALALDEISVSGARSQFLPDLRLGASAAENWGRTFSESEGRILSQTNQSSSVALSSSLTLFNGFGRVATLKAAIQDLEAGKQSTERTRQTVVFLVISGYLSVIEADAQLQVAEENLSAQEDQEALVQKFVDAGRSPISDLYQQQANVARARLLAVSARRTLELARLDLVRVLQLDPLDEYVFDAPALPDTIPSASPQALSDLLAEAFQNRGDYRALETQLQASQQQKRAASAAYWPTLTLSGSYGSSYSSGSSDRDLFQQFDDRRSGTLRLSFGLPLFDRFATSRSVQQANIGIDNARINLDDRRQTVALEVRRAVLDEQAARESLEAAQAQLRAATQGLEATQQRYEAGASTLYEVTLSRADLVQAQSSRVTAAYAVFWQKYVLDYYVGVLNPGGVLTP
jgi:outer membrane protein